MMRVLVTGACGGIGRVLCAGTVPGDGPLELIRSDLVDRQPASTWPFEMLDVEDPDSCARACRGVDAVIHLAADPDPGADLRTSVLPLNVLGSYNVFEAAVAAGVDRVVFASSVHVVAGHTQRPVAETAAPRPLNDYGAGKAFGEALCSSFAARSTTSFVAVRIGGFGASLDDIDPESRPAWLSHRDATQLLQRCVLARIDERYLVVNGTSANADAWLALDRARQVLGYAPQDGTDA